MHISMLRWCINKAIRNINVVKKQISLQICIFFCQNIIYLLIIKVNSCSNISACIFPKIFLMFEYKSMHVFSKTKCIFKYKCMHVYGRGYDTSLIDSLEAGPKTQGDFQHTPLFNKIV